MPIRKKDDRLGAKKRFNPRTGEETNKPGGVDPRTIYRPKPDVKPTEMNKGGLSPKQKAIASKAPPPNKIDAKDFAVLKAEKAKGRGMGLQDEKVKPGKVMKAKYGKMMKANRGEFIKRREKLFKNFDKTIGVFPKVSSAAGGKGSGTGGRDTRTITEKGQFVKRRMKLAGSKLPGKIGTALGIASMMVPAAYAAAKQYKDYKSAKNRDEAKVKKMGGGMAKKYSVGGGADTGTAGERRSSMYVLLDKMKSRRAEDRITKRDRDNIPPRRSRPAYAIGESMKDRDRLTTRDIHEATKSLKPSQRKSLRQSATLGYLPKPAIGKMGGGMMQRPMGYKSGTMVKARGCKLGKTRPTKMY